MINFIKKLFSKNKFKTEVKINPKFTDGLLQSVYYLVNKYHLEEERSVALSFNNFKEIFQRLLARLTILIEIEKKINYLRTTNFYNLSEDERIALQSDYMNKTEAFHQQVYATLSSFLQLIDKISPKKFQHNLPKWSIKKFITYSIKFEPKLTRVANELLNSEMIRNKCIDHPQQSEPFDWQTFTCISRTYIIYFNRDDSQNQIDITDKVKSPVKILSTFRAKEAFVTPHHIDVFDAICEYSYGLLATLTKV